MTELRSCRSVSCFEIYFISSSSRPRFAGKVEKRLYIRVRNALSSLQDVRRSLTVRCDLTLGRGLSSLQDVWRYLIIRAISPRAAD